MENFSENRDSGRTRRPSIPRYYCRHSYLNGDRESSRTKNSSAARDCGKPRGCCRKRDSSRTRDFNGKRDLNRESDSSRKKESCGKRVYSRNEELSVNRGAGSKKDSRLKRKDTGKKISNRKTNKAQKTIKKCNRKTEKLSYSSLANVETQGTQPFPIEMTSEHLHSEQTNSVKSSFVNKVYNAPPKHYTSEYTDGHNHWYFPNAEYSFFYSREYNTTTKVYRRLKMIDNFVATEESKKEESPPPGPLFMGKDATYPMDLNRLMFTNYCSLCNVRLASTITAHQHFVSKTHDRRISTWLKKTYTDKGLQPPVLKRFVAGMFPIHFIPKFKRAYHCKDCNTHLARVQRALEHYNGKRHRDTILQKTPLTGIGYFNLNGEWVKTGKVIDKVTGERTNYVLVKTPIGLHPVVLFVASKPSMVSIELHKKELRNTILRPELCLNARSTTPSPQRLELNKNDLNKKEALVKPLEGKKQNRKTKIANPSSSQLKEPEEPPAKKLHLQSKVNKPMKNFEEKAILNLENLQKKQREISTSIETKEQKKQPEDDASLQQEKKSEGLVHDMPASSQETPSDSTISPDHKSVTMQRDEFFDQFQAPYEAIDAEYCKICNVGVTSKEQMIPHLLGLRHSKKLRALGASRLSANEVFRKEPLTTPQTILESLDANDPLDLSLYRTPTGTYYCELCKVKALEPTRLKRHLLGKKHLMAVKRNPAAKLLAALKPK